MNLVIPGLAAALLLAMAPSLAEAKRKGKPAPEAAAAAGAEAPSGASAEELVARGEGQFRSGDHAGALRSFEAARAAQNTPTTTLWIAKCLDKLGRDAEARPLYERIAEKSPDPFDADEARQLLRAMDARGAAKAEPMARRDDDEAAPATAPADEPAATKPEGEGDGGPKAAKRRDKASRRDKKARRSTRRR